MVFLWFSYGTKQMPCFMPVVMTWIAATFPVTVPEISPSQITNLPASLILIYPDGRPSAMMGCIPKYHAQLQGCAPQL